jgi:perosamine synthetase
MVDLLCNQVVSALKSVVGAKPVPLHAPQFQGKEWDYLKQCLDSTFVSSVGPFVDRFEAELAVYTGARYAVAVMNGTAALHIALLLAGVQPGDEVLVPALTFVATANAVRYCGATPNFVDSEETTLGVAAAPLGQYLEQHTTQQNGQCVNTSTGQIIRALVPMHAFGHPADLKGLMAVAEAFNLVLIEDAAESLGSLYQGQHTGTFGHWGTLSFNGNKTITTGGGGALLTNDADLAQRAKHLTTTAKLSHPWEYVHDQVGYNYRLPNINAALGCAQLEHLPRFLTSKRRLYHRYCEVFTGIDSVKLMAEPPGCKSNYWLQTLILDQAVADQRDAILTATNQAGLMTRPAWRLMHKLEPYRNCPRSTLPVAESLGRRMINLPSSAGLV